MEKEIMVRKKRFAAFWLMVALVCSLVMPMAVSAQDYTVNDTTLPGKQLDKGDTITYPAETGSTATYSIYYKSSDGETTYYTDSASYNAKYTVLDITDSKLSAMPPQEGRTFAGWDVDTVYISSGTLYSVTLKARYTLNTYSITYELNGGTNAAGNPDKYTYGTGVAAFAEATREGYDFDKWCSNAGLTDEVKSISTTETGAVTLYAKWTAKSYSISYELNGGEHAAGNPTGYTYGEGVDSFAAATKDGYTFEGWYSDAAFTQKVDAIGTAQTGDVTLHAKFTKAITYELDGGTNAASNPASYVEGIGVSSLAAATKTGHSFLGWYLNGSPVTAIGANQTGDITLSAQWQANSYYIRYELDGGTNGSNPPTYTYGIGVASFKDAVKEGYTFEGWYSDDSFTTAVGSISMTQLDDVTLYAKFVYVPTVIEAGTHELVAGVQYKLGNVTKVSGDTSVYASGSTFFVSESGTYTFS